MDVLPDKLKEVLPKKNRIQELSEIKEEVVGKAIIYLLNKSVNFFFEDFCFNEDTNNDDHDKHLKDVQTILDMTWEKLNTGDWKNVNLSWRHLYSYATLFKILFLYARKNENYQIDALKACDMGIIMGFPIMDNLLSRIASVLTEEVNSLKDNDCEIIHEHQIKRRTHFKPVILKSNKIERITNPSLEEFKSNYMNKNQPVIIEDVINNWPALSTHKWSIDYLLKKAGSRTVPIEIGNSYTDESWSQKLMILEEFAENYILKQTNEIGYLAQYNLFDQILELRADIAIPTYCCLSESEDEVDINAWFGPEGTVSPLHHDPKHNLLAQVMGEKYIRLYAESATSMLYPHTSKLLNNTSQVDVENPDLNKHPLFSSASYQECILQSGDLLYIPPHYWHFVRSLSVSFSVSFWWK